MLWLIATGCHRELERVDTGVVVVGVDAYGTVDDQSGSGELTWSDRQHIGDFINVTVPFGGDDSCLDLPRSVVSDERCTESATVGGGVVDIQTLWQVPGAEVEPFPGRDPRGVPDQSVVSDATGRYSVTLDQCTPFSMRTSARGFVDTWSLNAIVAWSPKPGFSPWAYPDDMIRYTLSELDATWEPELSGIVMGTVSDCQDALLANVQVYLHDGWGNPPPDTAVFYFDDAGQPALTQRATSPRGRWIAIGLPPSDWVVEVWGWDGGGYTLLSSSPVPVSAGGVHIVPMFLASEDGLSYPPACTATCEG